MIANKEVHTALNQHATTGELLEVVFSVVHAATVAMQQCGEHSSAATIEQQ